MESFGSYIKSHREKKGIRLEEIASITKIHIHSLQLLEKGQWENLPSEPFIRGFILAYAKYVGLDTKEVIEKYLEDIGTNTSEMPIPEGEQESDPQDDPKPVPIITSAAWTIPTRSLFAGVVALGVLVVLGWLVSVGKKATNRSAVPEITSDQPIAKITEEQVPKSNEPSGEASLMSAQGKDTGSVTTSPPVKMEAGTAESSAAASKTALVAELQKPFIASKADSETVAKNEAQNPLAQFSHEVIVIGKERSWIKVVLDDKPPIEFFLKKDERLAYSAKSKIKVVLGFAPGTQVFYNGAATEGVKYQGTIRFFIFPPDARFPQDRASKRTKEKPIEEPQNESSEPEESPIEKNESVGGSKPTSDESQ